MALLLIYVIELVTFTASSTHYSTSIWKSLVFVSVKSKTIRETISDRQCADINKSQHTNARPPVPGSGFFLLFSQIRLVSESVLSYARRFIRFGLTTNFPNYA